MYFLNINNEFEGIFRITKLQFFFHFQKKNAPPKTRRGIFFWKKKKLRFNFRLFPQFSNQLKDRRAWILVGKRSVDLVIELLFCTRNRG
jgi:hypothetical protein